MKTQRILLALTLLNLAAVAFLLARTRRSEASAAPGLLRGSALEIVDAQGRVRASIRIQPEDPAHPLPDGSPRPENVILRLITPDGRPTVKLGGSAAGAGLGLIGASDARHVILKAEGGEVYLKLVDEDRQRLVQPGDP
jgi:hypothetical protein